jgi:hypothetical protein
LEALGCEGSFTGLPTGDGGGSRKGTAAKHWFAEPSNKELGSYSPTIKPGLRMSISELERAVASTLRIPLPAAADLVTKAESLYQSRMRVRFSETRLRDRLKRTNPFLLRIRGVGTVLEWATVQVRSTLFASEEEAVGHLLEAIAKAVHPGATNPRYPDDFDYEVILGELIHGYQVKMSWDCMPMSSRKNLSNTIRKLRSEYGQNGQEFIGHFAPCYGKAHTTTPLGQDYVSLGSKEFWTRVGGGDVNFDCLVGDTCALICSEFRSQLEHTLLPDLINRLEREAQVFIGNPDGTINYSKLFRAVNR